MEHQEEKNINVSTTKKPTIGIPAAIITGFVIVALAIVFTNTKKVNNNQNQVQKSQETPTSVSKDIATIRAEDHVSGDRNSEIAIITYSDGDCPFCAKFHSTMENLLEENKNIAWVYRHLPLDIHPNAFNEAVALECAANLGGEKAFWGYLDSTINVTLDPEDQNTPNKLIEFAKKEGINEDSFKKCFSDEVGTQKILKEIDEIAEAGARGTPFSIVVNQKTGKQTIIPGAAQIENMREIIKNLK